MCPGKRESDLAVDGESKSSTATWGEPGEGEPLPVTDAERLASELLAGLAHLHARGGVHRDVKAGNVLVAALLECRRGAGSRSRLERALAVVRQRARWDLPAYLDLPFHLALAAEAAIGMGERELAAGLLAEAEVVRPGLELVADVRAGLVRR